MDPIEHYQAGRLADAIATATKQVKAAPQSLAKRRLLCELLCFTGDYERADKHLDVILSQDPKSLPMTSLFRQLLRAEQARQEVHTSGRVPEFLQPPSDELQLRLRAMVELRAGNDSHAAELLAKAESMRPRIQGTCDASLFDDFRDLDELSASIFEVLTSTGKYYWVPMNSVVEVQLHAPARLRDLLWRPARMKVRDGPDGEVFLAAIYAGSHSSRDEKMRLGRASDWRGVPVRGVGQREFLVGNSSAAISQIEAIQFSQKEA